MSSSRNNNGGNFNNNVTRTESPNSVPSIVYSSRPVTIIHGGTFHGTNYIGSSSGSNSRSQSPHVSDSPFPNRNE